MPDSKTTPLLALEDLHVTYPIQSSVLHRVTGHVHAVDGVSLSIQQGRTLSIVGESGCGKTSTARAVAGLTPISSGRIRYSGADLANVRGADRRRLARDIQMVFQDPYASLNPRLTVRAIVEEGWRIHRDLVPRNQWGSEVERLLGLVGLDPAHADRYPHQFSGGQRQRIGIARALSMRPRLIICDEPVSALDVSIQAQVLNLLKDLQRDFALTYLFISHDLSVVRHISDDIAVMYLGAVVESGPVTEVFDRPRHPYTRALLSAVPVAFPWRGTQPERTLLTGDLPSPTNPPAGCRFHTRCPIAQPNCAQQPPPLIEDPSRHAWACPVVGTEAEQMGASR